MMAAAKNTVQLWQEMKSRGTRPNVYAEDVNVGIAV